jgi:hypothetical protein
VIGKILLKALTVALALIYIAVSFRPALLFFEERAASAGSEVFLAALVALTPAGGAIAGHVAVVAWDWPVWQAATVYGGLMLALTGLLARKLTGALARLLARPLQALRARREAAAEARTTTPAAAGRVASRRGPDRPPSARSRWRAALAWAATTIGVCATTLAVPRGALDALARLSEPAPFVAATALAFAVALAAAVRLPGLWLLPLLAGLLLPALPVAAATLAGLLMTQAALRLRPAPLLRTEGFAPHGVVDRLGLLAERPTLRIAGTRLAGAHLRVLNSGDRDRLGADDRWVSAIPAGPHLLGTALGVAPQCVLLAHIAPIGLAWRMAQPVPVMTVGAVAVCTALVIGGSLVSHSDERGSATD